MSTITIETPPTPEWMERNKGNALTHTTLHNGREVHTVIQKRFRCRYDVYYAAFDPAHDHSAMIQRFAEAHRAFVIGRKIDRANDSHISSGGDRECLFSFLLQHPRVHAPQVACMVYLADELHEFADEVYRNLQARKSCYDKALSAIEQAMKDFDKNALAKL